MGKNGCGVVMFSGLVGTLSNGRQVLVCAFVALETPKSWHPRYKRGRGGHYINN